MRRAPIAMAVLLALSACKQESTKSGGPAPGSDKTEATPKSGADAAPGPKTETKTETIETETPPAAGVPALGQLDAGAAKQIVERFTTVRKLFDKTADDDVTPTASQKKALAALALEGGFDGVKALAEDVGWGQAARRVWLERTASESAKELKSIVRMPLELCVGWGSATPSDYVATGCMNAAVFFVTPVGDTKLIDACGACSAKDDDALADCRDKRCALVVEGYFTGKTVETKGAPPGERGPSSHEFFVQKARTGKTSTTLRLPGGHGPAGGPAITSGPRWGVMWANAFATNKDPLAEAAEVARKLAAAGFPKAEMIDSRRIPSLWCCSQAVLVGRFDTKAEAQAEAKAAGKAVKNLIVRELY